MKTPVSSHVFAKVRIAQVSVLLSGASFAFGLARFLYHAAPFPATDVFGQWPGSLALSAAGATLAFLLYKRLIAQGHRSSQSVAGNGPLPASAPDKAAAFLPGFLPLVDVVSGDVNLLRAQVLLVGGGAGILALLARAFLGEQSRRKQAPRGAISMATFGPPSIAALVLLALYVRSLAPTVGEADTFEFQVAIARLGVAHPTGYPLFILLGRAFTALPLGGSLAYRANLASAVCGVLAALGGYLIMRRLGADRLISATTCLLIGVSPTLWSRSVEAEVYSLHAALVAVLLWLLLCFSRSQVNLIRAVCRRRPPPLPRRQFCP